MNKLMRLIVNIPKYIINKLSRKKKAKLADLLDQLEELGIPKGQITLGEPPKPLEDTAHSDATRDLLRGAQYEEEEKREDEEYDKAVKENEEKYKAMKKMEKEFEKSKYEKLKESMSELGLTSPELGMSRPTPSGSPVFAPLFPKPPFAMSSGYEQHPMECTCSICKDKRTPRSKSLLERGKLKYLKSRGGV